MTGVQTCALPIFESRAQLTVDRLVPVPDAADPTLAEVARMARASADISAAGPAAYLYPSPLIPLDRAIAEYCAADLSPDRNALEAGIGYLSERDGLEPVAILEAIVAGRLARADMLLLARFANATWKASQPFRSLSRITRDSFRPAALLSAEELAKDYVQVDTAAARLLEAMKRP